MRTETTSDTIHRLFLDDGQEIVLIGTAHVSQTSVEEVRTLIDEEEPDAEDEEAMGAPIAIKIVTAAARGSEEASQNIIVGSVNYVDTETNTFMIDGDSMSFEFACSPEIAGSISEGNTVKVVYDGCLYQRGVTAVSVTPVSIVGTGR